MALEYFDIYAKVLSTLRNDSDKTIKKGVSNNLNDLFKEAPERFDYIISKWKEDEVSKECAWIIKHGARTKDKLERELSHLPETF